jgi:outer membrane protein OmpA-like peptidoglycan-associated protein
VKGLFTHLGLFLAALLVVSGIAAIHVSAAGKRLAAGPAHEEPRAAVADHAELAYCTPPFKQVLQRVLSSCGLLSSGGRRSCQPSELQSIASISGADFNALFAPLEDRGAVLLFDKESSDLDDAAKRLLDERWDDRRGARYFLVVARASPTGSARYNQELSHKRANSILFHLQERERDDPEIERRVGLLWLGEEFAQLGTGFCGWTTSRPETRCTTESINRSAFVSWVDCRL